MRNKILIVDDEPDLLKLTVFRLIKNGYEVITAVDGKEAIEMVDKETPDLILLDMRLPFMSGIEVCKKIKDTDKLKCIPVILFTASTGSIEENVKDAGADDFLFKPFDEKILLEKLKKFLG